jgi:hypothetical protein
MIADDVGCHGYIETGLETAEAGNDVGWQAELLSRKSNWLIRVGRFAEAGPIA